MNSRKIYSIFISAILLLLTVRFGAPVQATDCTYTRPYTSIYMLQTGACSFPNAIDGVVTKSGTTNISQLKLQNGTYLTIGASEPQTLIVGEMKIDTGAQVVIVEGSQIIIGKDICYQDEDGDGYPRQGGVAATTCTRGGTCPNSWANCVDAATFSAGSYKAFDCDDTNAALTTDCSSSASYERSKVVGTETVGYYQEIGKDPSLVGLWHFNETSGNASDSSGNGNTGTPTGTTIVDGLMGKARSFDGNNDVINVGSAANLDFGNNGAFTFSGWVKPTTLVDYAGFVSKDTTGRASPYSYMTTFMANGRLETYNGGAWADLCPSGSVVNGNWQHIAFVYNGTTIYGYVNGVQCGSAAFSYTDYAAHDVTIGSWYAASTIYDFNGLMDEVAIYSRALAPEEIKAQAKRSPWARYTSPVIDMGSAKASVPLAWTGLGIGTRIWSSGTLDTTNEGQIPKDSNNLVAQWNFDELLNTAASNAAGSCASSCNGTLTGFTNVTAQDALAGSGWTLANKKWGAGALMFDNTNDFVTVTSNTSLENQTFSISLWARKNNPSGATQGGIAKGIVSGGAADLEYQIEFHNSYARFNISNGSSGNSAASADIPDADWHQYVAVADADTLKMYRDGILKSNVARTVGNISYAGHKNLIMGSRADGTVPFNGILDAVSIYSRVLTSSEILSNYQAGNIEFQWRAGTNATPDSTDYASGTNWTQWAPSGGASYESQIDAMDSTQASWYWDINAAGSADGTTALYTPKTKAQDTTRKIEGTGSMKVSLGQPQSDANTVGLWHFEETGPGVGVTQFNSSGTYTPSVSGNVAVLVVAGGGGGGEGNGAIGGGGGGAGGYTYNPSFAVTVQAYTVTIGDGGAGAIAYQAINGVNGSNSVFGTTITSTGGGGGNSYNSAEGSDGGSGGGAAWTEGIGHGISGQGNNGGTGSNSSSAYGGGGGGGANAVGGNGSGSVGGNGGIGYLFSSTGSYYAGGGGGGSVAGTPGSGGAGGGGAGGYNVAGSAATPNTGGGGGAGAANGHNGGKGGSGVVLVDDGFKLNDSVGTNHGTPVGTTLVDGVFGKARSFNGSSDYVSVPNNAAWNFGANNFTAEWWEYRKNNNSYNPIIARDNATYTPYLFGHNSGPGTLTVYITSNGSSWDIANNRSLGAPILNQWTHYAVTRSGSTFTTYQNGFQQDTWQSSATIQSSSSPLQIGKYATSSFYTGNIDEVRISNSARTADEIAEAYRAGRDHRVSRTISPAKDLTNTSKLPFWFAGDRLGTYMEATVGNSAFANYETDANTVGLWHLEEQAGSGAYIKDNSTNGNHGTPTNATFAQGILGKGRRFDGSNDFINFGSPASLDFGNNGVFTFSGWFYPTLLDYEALLCKTVTGRTGAAYTYYTSFMSNGQLQVYSPAVGTNKVFCSAGSVVSGKWQHVAFVYDGTNMTGYVNGVKCGSTAFSYTDVAAHDVTIGSFYTTTTYDYNGVMDELRIDNIARTPAQIREAAEIGRRTHPITVDFKANLVAGALIDGSGDTAFSVDEGFYSITDVTSTGTAIGTAGASGQTYDKAFDGSVVPVSVGSYCSLNAGTNTAYTGQDFGAGVTKNIYQVKLYGTSSYTFNSKLQYSDDCSGWTDTNVVTVIPASTSTVYTYNVSNYGAHRCWRFLDTGNTTYMQIGEIEMYEKTVGGASHLFVGDKIIVKENVGGTEYIAQGKVATVNSSTGAVTVTAWDTGSTFPTGGQTGFSVNATVFKWQREIMDLTGSLPSQRSAITYLTFRPTDMSSGATMWIDDIRSGGPYLNTSPQTLTPSSAKRYFQLRALFSTTDTAISSSLTSLSSGSTNFFGINPTLTPTPIASDHLCWSSNGTTCDVNGCAYQSTASHSVYTTCTQGSACTNTNCWTTADVCDAACVNVNVQSGLYYTGCRCNIVCDEQHNYHTCSVTTATATQYYNLGGSCSAGGTSCYKLTGSATSYGGCACPHDGCCSGTVTTVPVACSWVAGVYPYTVSTAATKYTGSGSCDVNGTGACNKLTNPVIYYTASAACPTGGSACAGAGTYYDAPTTCTWLP